MMCEVRVVYVTECLLHRNWGEVGSQSERFFATLEEAKAEPLPQSHSLAFVQVSGGHLFKTKTEGWQLVLRNTKNSDTPVS